MAPSGYRRHAVCQHNPELCCAQAKRDEALMPLIQQAWQANSKRIALAEKINGLYKVELNHRLGLGPVHHRLLEPIGYISPVEAEANYDKQLAGQTATVLA